MGECGERGCGYVCDVEAVGLEAGAEWLRRAGRLWMLRGCGWLCAYGLGRADFVPRPEFLVGSCEDRRGFVGEIDFPPLRQDTQDAQRASRAEPAFGDFFQMLDPVDDVALGVLLRQIEQVDRARRVRNVHADVADLAQAVRPLVQAQELGYHGRRLRALLAWRHIRWERRVVRVVLEEGPEEVDVEQLEEHTARWSATPKVWTSKLTA